MILDKQNLFSVSQAVTSTAKSADVIDLGPLYAANSGRDIGSGTPMQILINVDAAVMAAGAATVNFQIITSDKPDLSSPVTIWDSGAVSKDVLTGGVYPTGKLPRGPYKRYIGMNYLVITGPLTAGKFTTGLIFDAQDNKSYATSISGGAL